MSRRGSGVSSAIVDTASNPRNDRHSTAAPASSGPRPDEGSTPPAAYEALPTNGSHGLTSAPTAPTAITTNVTTNSTWAVMMATLALAMDSMPITFSTVTATMAVTMNTHGAMAGNWVLR